MSVANHGAEALDFLRGTTYARGVVDNDRVPVTLDVILMDWEMPVMDGLTAVREIRKMERDGGPLSGHVPVIAVTANVRNEQITKAMDAGMVSVCFSLPFSLVWIC